MPDYNTGLVRSRDIPLLADIEKAAASIFPRSQMPEHLFAQSVPLDILHSAQQAGELFCAWLDDKPVGFALFQNLEGMAHLAELDVHPDHMRKGLGSRLIEHCAEHAKSLGYTQLYLTTFANIAWNAPFYARRGFRILTEQELPQVLAKALQEQAASGMTQRVGMGRLLT